VSGSVFVLSAAADPALYDELASFTRGFRMTQRCLHCGERKRPCGSNSDTRSRISGPGAQVMVTGRQPAPIVSISSLWKRYFDQRSAAFASAMRPGELSPDPSRVWESYREAAATGIAMRLTDVASAQFARLYASSLVNPETASMA
jgi:hypothetical protein